MEDIVSRALSDYRAQFGYDFDPSWKPKTEQDVIDLLQSSKVDFVTWRAKHEKVWKSLSVIVKPIIQCGQIASTGAGSTYPAASAALGGLIALVKACDGVSEAYDYLDQMFSKLSHVLGRWNVDLRHDLDHHLGQEIQQTMVILLAIIARSRKLLKHSRARRYFVNLAFGKDQKTAELVTQLENLLQSEDRTRLALSLDRVTALWELATHAESARIVERLNSPSVTANGKTFAEVKEEKLQDTGTWFEREQLYQYWMKRDVRLLMLLGGPGSGKTFLAAGLVDVLLQEHHQRATMPGTTSVAYTFARKGDDLATVLRTLAYQVQETNVAYRSHVTDVFDQTDLHTVREIWSKLFLDYWNQHTSPQERLLLVFDGLSELPAEQVEIFAQEMVKESMQEASSSIQFAVFGRLQLWADFNFIASERYIKVDAMKNKTDLLKYIDQELAKVRVLRRASVEEKTKFQQKILQRCDGVFEWARLLLAKCRNQEKHRILKILDDPPTTLDDMVEACFKQILDDEDIEPQMLRAILTWTVYSQRPLKFGELYDKVRLTTGEDYALMWFNIVRRLSSIIRWKSPNIRQWHGQEVGDDNIEILEDVDGEWSDNLSTTLVMLGNSRIRDYVILQSTSDGRHSSTHADKFPPKPQNAECEIVKICLKSLQQKKLRRLKFRYLIQYPARHMVLHLRNLKITSLADEDRVEVATGLIRMFYEDDCIETLSWDYSDSGASGKRDFWHLWIQTDRNTEAVQSWLKWYLESQTTIQEDEERWLRGAATSKKELLRPWAAYFRRVWLTKRWDVEKLSRVGSNWFTASEMVRDFVLAHDYMDGHGQVPARFRHFYQLGSHHLSPGEIVALAENSNVSQDMSYLMAVSWTLWLNGNYEVALKYARKASEQGQDSWAPPLLMSMAYGQLYELERALELSENIRNLHPADQVLLLTLRSMWLLKSNKARAALAEIERAYTTTPGLTRVHAIYLCCSRACRDADATLKFLKRLKDTAGKDGELPPVAAVMCGRLINNYYSLSAVGHAYRFGALASDQSFILETMRDVTASIIRLESDSNQCRWVIDLARFHCAHVEGGLEKGLRMLDECIQKLEEGRWTLDERDGQVLLLRVLSWRSFWTLRQAQRQKLVADPELSDTVKMLEGLSLQTREVDVSAMDAEDRFNFHRPSLFLGHWLCSGESDRGDGWRVHFKGPVLECLDMLDDMDPSNDFWGARHLSRVLRLAGDSDNANALQSMFLGRLSRLIADLKTRAVQPEAKEGMANDSTGTRSGSPLQSDARAQSQKGSQTPRSVTAVYTSDGLALGENGGGEEVTEALSFDADLSYGCGACQVLVVNLDELYECATCGNSLCKTCLPTTTEHPCSGRECGNHHRFDKVWPVSTDLVNRIAVRKGDAFHLKKSWLEEMRATWKAADSASGW